MEQMTVNSYEELGLTKQDLGAMYETMVRARKIDERMWKLNRAGKIPFVVSCQGQEAAQVGAAFALEKGTDYILPYYRDVAVVLHFGQTARDLMLSAFAKAEDPNSGGRQMPGHFGSKQHRIVTGSSPVTTQVPHAVGVALAAKLKKEELVTFVSFGEGSSNQGDFHEGANFAGVHKLPVILFCENNKYAISVPLLFGPTGGAEAPARRARVGPGQRLWYAWSHGRWDGPNRRLCRRERSPRPRPSRRRPDAHRSRSRTSRTALVG